MEVGRLSPTAALIAAIQGERVRRPRGDRAALSDPVKSGKSAGALHRQLAEVVRGLSLEDPQALRSARHQLVRTVLLWEFGSALREHSDWRPMLQRIEARLDASDPQGNALAELVRQLQRELR